MFAPKVLKAQTKALENSFSKTPGSQAILRLLEQQTSRQQGGATENMMTGETSCNASWDFSKIPLSPPDRPGSSPQPSIIQRKLVVGQPNEPLEHEADRVADQAMRMPALEIAVAAAPPQISRKCAACETGEEEQLPKKQARALEAMLGEAPASVHAVLGSPGQPLADTTRAYFEPRFGRDLSGVRVHTGAAAEQSAREVSAHAYTVGRDIVFAAGRLTQDTHDGRRLMAHELTHVLQQSEDGPSRSVADNGKSGPRSVSSTLSSIRRLQRDPDPVLDLHQNGDVWELKLDGITDATAAGRLIWPSGVPKGVRITAIVDKKPSKVGVFQLTGMTLKAVDSMASRFQSWFTITGSSWTTDGLKKLLDACDGGLAIWSKAKKANKGKDPKVTPGAASYTDNDTGDITLDKTTDQCHAVQALIHELSNLASLDQVKPVAASASAGDLSRDDFIKALEKIEFDVGVKNALTAFDACKDKWLCRDSIMEFARKAKNFDEYYQKLLKPAHKEKYGEHWDKKYKKAYDKKHHP